MKAKITLYACGGAGLNIASHFENFRGSSETGLATIEPVYIDTSKSNITNKIPEDFTYHVEGLDGSGKVRAENHSQISECVLDILHKHQPTDINIVLSSASGGSGSVIAPSLVSELLHRDVPTIVIIVGSTDSRIELVNTIRTLKSYEAIAQLRKSPVSAMYYENSPVSARKSVDTDIHTAITLLSTLFSGENRELDSSDLKNWLKYNKVTAFDSHLSFIDFYKKKIVLEKGITAITVATLAVDDGETSPGTDVEYQCVGYIKKEVLDKIGLDAPIHVAVLDGAITVVHKRLDKTLQSLDEARNARIVKTSILSEKDVPTSNGLIL